MNFQALAFTTLTFNFQGPGPSQGGSHHAQHNHTTQETLHDATKTDFNNLVNTEA